MRRLGSVGVACLVGVLQAGALGAAEVPGAPGEIRPLLVGTAIPDVTLTSLGGDPVPLREAVAQKPTVIIFYRGGW